MMPLKSHEKRNVDLTLVFCLVAQVLATAAKDDIVPAPNDPYAFTTAYFNLETGNINREVLDHFTNPADIELGREFRRKLILKCAAGGMHVLLLAQSARETEVYSVGNGEDGQLGLGDNKSTETVTKVSLSKPVNVVAFLFLQPGYTQTVLFLISD